VLEDFPGLGPVRRAALLQHFGSIEKIRAASPVQLQDAPGFGPKLAAELHAYLHRPEPAPTQPDAAAAVE
jgi:excinuclease ABC subunit C